MDPRKRDALIRRLYAEMVRSAEMSLDLGAAWLSRSASFAAAYPPGSAELRIAKRDDLQLKDLLAKGNWHAGNAGFCSGVIGTLMDEKVRKIVERR